MLSKVKVTRYHDRTVAEVFCAGGGFAGGGATERAARLALLEAAAEFAVELSVWVEREMEALNGSA